MFVCNARLTDIAGAAGRESGAADSPPISINLILCFDAAGLEAGLLPPRTAATYSDLRRRFHSSDLVLCSAGAGGSEPR